jgi:hypothetical protein
MENPLDVQKSLYGEDGPPMMFMPEASALQLEMRAPTPPPAKRAKDSAFAPNEGPNKRKSESREKKRAMSAEEIFAQIRHSQRSLSSHDNNDGISSSISRACQLPGDFPPELSFRSLAAYSLLRTLSIQLRLSPFTPNALLRALYLPTPNRLLGEIHVALLRILFVQKLKSMGYSYKPGGGGVGVTKRRQVDGIRWPLLAGDNLTHLDAHSWPLFYDDYCHLTADRLWESYHGPLDGDVDESQDNQNFIDFRNIGVFVPPAGEEYRTKLHADDVDTPMPIFSGIVNTGEREQTKPKLDERINDRNKRENLVEKKNDELLPLHVPSGAIKKDDTELAEAIAMSNSDGSDSEDEYQDDDDNDDAFEEWEKPKLKKRRRTAKKTTSAIHNVTETATTKGTPLASKEQTSSSVPNHWSHITSMESSISTPVIMPPQKVSTNQNPSSDPSWSRIASMEPSFSSPRWSPRQGSIEYSPSQSQQPPQPHVSSSVLESDSIPPKTDFNQSIHKGNNLSSKSSTTTATDNDDFERKSSKTISIELSLPSSMKSDGLTNSEMDESGPELPVQSNENNDSLSGTNAVIKNSVGSKSTIPSTDSSLSISINSCPPKFSNNERNNESNIQISNELSTVQNLDTIVSSTTSNESQCTIPSSSARMQDNSIVKTLQQDQPNKSTQPNLVSQLPKQQHQQQHQNEEEEQQLQKQQDHVSRNAETSNNADISAGTDPARIRGGGAVDDSKFVVPSNTGSSRQNAGRSRGSRRALPMRSSPSQTSSFPTHVQNAYMLQLQQQQQQQQYLFYQSQIHKNFGGSQSITHGYPPFNTNSRENPMQFQYQAGYNIASNEKLQTKTGAQAYYENHVQDLDMPFVVPDKMAEILNAFVGESTTHKRKVEDIEDTDDNIELDDSENIDTDDAFENELETKRWLHFKPLKAMRSGLPYHRLPTEDKVCILEFLIDELLTVDAISAEFTKRQNQESHHASPYGILPKEDEYQNLENKDECAVCGQEGDLLCCDGCLSSYHAGCLSMKAGQVLPEGKWLCPECSLVDPCNYGSLYGGRKGALDWFALDDIKNTSKIQHQHNYYGSTVPPSSLNLSSDILPTHDVYMSQNPTPTIGMGIVGNPSAGSASDAIIKTSIQSRSIGNLQKWKGRQFIVVHGFVFCRDSTEANASFDILKSAKPYSMLTKAEFEAFTSHIDDELSHAWPLVQIPFPESCSWKFPSVKDYFNRIGSINPFLYNNKYHRAPVPLISKVGSAHNMAKLMYLTYENECNKPYTSKVSEVLTEDFSFDAEISTCLKRQSTLFDPYRFLKGYMLKLEHTLRRSCMLNEFWEGGQFRSSSDVWISNVRGAKSIRALSRFLLKLVNAMHAKAFSGYWFHSHISRSSDSETSVSERNYQALPTDWSEEKEKLKRKWETTPSKMILSLCSDYDNDLMGFASKIRSDIFIAKQINVTKSKRKPKKAGSSMKSKTGFRTKVGTNTKEQSGIYKFENPTSRQPTFAKEEERKLVDAKIVITNPQNIANEEVKVDQAPRESVRDPALIKLSEVPESGTKEQQHTNSKKLERSEREPMNTDVQFHMSANSTDEEKTTDASYLTKIPANTNIEQEKVNQLVRGSDFYREENESAEARGIHTDGKIELAETSKPLETCEGKTETTNAIISTYITDRTMNDAIMTDVTDGKTETMNEIIQTDATDEKTETMNDMIQTDATDEKTETTNHLIQTDANEGISETMNDVIQTDAIEGKTETMNEIIQTDATDEKTETMNEIVQTDATDGKTETTNDIIKTDAIEGKSETRNDVIQTDATDGKTETMNDVIPTDATDGKSETMNDVIQTDAIEGKTETMNEIIQTNATDEKTETVIDIIPTDARDGKTETRNDVIQTDATDGKSEIMNDVIKTDAKDEKTETTNDVIQTDATDEKTETRNDVIPTDATDKRNDAKPPAPVSSTKKKRKKTKLNTRDSFPRRRTRHSGRLSSEVAVGNSMATNASELKQTNESVFLGGMTLQIENVKKKKASGLEKLLKGQYAVEGIWPIAGRRIFPTVGNIPPRGKSIAFFFSFFLMVLIAYAHNFLNFFDQK